MKTILSLDGGGVRGAITVAFLERIEEVMGAGPENPLAHKIDLAGGTSTGAIIAGAVALGFSAADLRQFYLDLAPRVFRRSNFRVPGLQSKFDSAALKRELVAVCGDRRLDTDDLLTGFALVMKRMDTGSPWIVANNPASAYWNDPEDGSYHGNRHYRLADLIRASTAAPHYFAPEAIDIAADEPPGLFVDGGVTPHNNPALALLQLVTVPAHGYGWETGTDKLRIISVGTGDHRERLDATRARWMTSASLAISALKGMIRDSQVQVLALMQALGETPTPWTINSEIGDLAGFNVAGKPLFTFLRYDVILEQAWLADELDMKLSQMDVKRLQQMDNPAIVSLAYEVGRRAAERFVQPEHFDVPRG
ncbi:patatin-like phospholipase family protein [Tepidamorphus sp. 3E244]|uniref:patatin-like phospholipase family protein n=1 Tax=Tepidamorphus sp. 3E244 TaxID=3385498 RepID=UPI0038FCDA16